MLSWNSQTAFWGSPCQFVTIKSEWKAVKTTPLWICEGLLVSSKTGCECYLWCVREPVSHCVSSDSSITMNRLVCSNTRWSRAERHLVLCSMINESSVQSFSSCDPCGDYTPFSKMYRSVSWSDVWLNVQAFETHFNQLLNNNDSINYSYPKKKKTESWMQ